MPSLLANGVRLHYREAGSGPETVAFSHSYALDSSHFAPQLDAFASRYRCIAFDHRGHGQSEVAREGYEMHDLYADGVAFLEALGTGPVHFVGLSTGGFVGMRIALRRPELLRSLVLMDTSAKSEPRRKRLKYEAMFAVIKRFGFRPLRGPILSTFFGSAFLDDPDRKPDVDRMWTVLQQNDRAAAIAFGHGIFGRDDILGELGRIHTPTLVMVGEHDVATPRERAKEIAGAIDGAQLVVIPRAGHVGTIEEPEVVNGELGRFWDGVG